MSPLFISTMELLVDIEGQPVELVACHVAGAAAGEVWKKVSTIKKGKTPLMRSFFIFPKMLFWLLVYWSLNSIFYAFLFLLYLYIV